MSNMHFIFIPLFAGRIVNISSVLGRYSFPGDCAYHLSKSGMEAMSDSLRLEMRSLGVGVSIVEPGQFDAATTCSNPEIVSLSPARAGRVKPNTFNIGSDCSFAKSTAFRSVGLNLQPCHR
jgi:NAD(P)-dependent dehydrogenase (short-subunit alcohol dehydrogenase family)